MRQGCEPLTPSAFPEDTTVFNPPSWLLRSEAQRSKRLFPTPFKDWKVHLHPACSKTFQGPQSRFHSLAQRLLQFPFLSPTPGHPGVALKAQHTNPRLSDFQISEYAGPLPRGAFPPHCGYNVPCSSSQMLLKKSIRAPLPLSLATANLLSPRSQLFLLTGHGALNSPHPDWAWLLSPNHSSSQDPTIPQSSRPWQHPPCLLPKQGPLVPKPRRSFLTPCQ